MRRGSRDGDPPSRSGGLSASLARADASGDAERAYGRSSSYGSGPVPRASSSGADRGPEQEESPRAKRERWGATYRSPYAQSAGMDIPSAGASRRSRIGAAPAYDSATRSYGRDHYASRAEAQPRSFSRAPISPSSDDRPAGLPSRRALDRRASTDLGSSPTTAFERHDAQRRRDAEARDADVIARALGRASVVESRPLASRRDGDDDARVNIFGHDHRAHPGHPSASSAPSRVGSSSAERRARLLDRARRVAADRSTPDPAAGSGEASADARFFGGRPTSTKRALAEDRAMARSGSATTERRSCSPIRVGFGTRRRLLPARGVRFRVFARPRRDRRATPRARAPEGGDARGGRRTPSRRRGR